MKFPQKITFTATLETDTEGLDWVGAVDLVEKGLTEGDLDPAREDGRDPYELKLVKVTRMEIIEGDAQYCRCRGTGKL